MSLTQFEIDVDRTLRLLFILHRRRPVTTDDIADRLTRLDGVTTRALNLLVRLDRAALVDGAYVPVGPTFPLPAPFPRAKEAQCASS